MDIFLPQATIGNFEAQGVLGLAPSLDEKSYVE